MIEILVLAHPKGVRTEWVAVTERRRLGEGLVVKERNRTMMYQPVQTRRNNMAGRNGGSLQLEKS
jgi:hypothetical protein